MRKKDKFLLKKGDLLKDEIKFESFKLIIDGEEVDAEEFTITTTSHYKYADFKTVVEIKTKRGEGK